MTLLIGAGLLGSALWAMGWLLPIGLFRIRHSLQAGTSRDADLADITALIPARDERETLGAALDGLAAQGCNLRVIVVDDQSSDGTASIAGSHPLQPRVVAGTPRPQDWLGKVWALHQGLAHVETPLVLLIDADIRLEQGLLPAMREKLRAADLGLVSLMAELRMEGFWERLLAPAYVYFFRLLYPFGLVAARAAPVAAAAGGCVLLRREALLGAGGFAAMRGAIIDDCRLASLVKSGGHGIWLGLTRDVRSLRPCATLRDFWMLVSRSAYAQLRFSPLLLVACTAGMATLYGGPPALAVAGDGAARWIGLAGTVAMVGGYVPLLRYYGLGVSRSLTLPLIALGYLLMTWHSALRYWRGTRTVWKGRTYASTPGSLNS